MKRKLHRGTSWQHIEVVFRTKNVIFLDASSIYVTFCKIKLQNMAITWQIMAIHRELP